MMDRGQYVMIMLLIIIDNDDNYYNWTMIIVNRVMITMAIDNDTNKDRAIIMIYSGPDYNSDDEILS